jgi:hypothetical protein
MIGLIKTLNQYIEPFSDIFIAAPGTTHVFHCFQLVSLPNRAHFWSSHCGFYIHINTRFNLKIWRWTIFHQTFEQAFAYYVFLPKKNWFKVNCPCLSTFIDNIPWLLWLLLSCQLSQVVYIFAQQRVKISICNLFQFTNSYIMPK